MLKSRLLDNARRELAVHGTRAHGVTCWNVKLDLHLPRDNDGFRDWLDDDLFDSLFETYTRAAFDDFVWNLNEAFPVTYPDRVPQFAFSFEGRSGGWLRLDAWNVTQGGYCETFRFDGRPETLELVMAKMTRSTLVRFIKILRFINAATSTKALAETATWMVEGWMESYAAERDERDAKAAAAMESERPDLYPND